MTTQIKLGDRMVGQTDRPYVIAEIGVNHEGSLATAKLLIESAKRGGADAAKFQTYKAGLIASKFSPSYWDTSKEPTTSQQKDSSERRANRTELVDINSVGGVQGKESKNKRSTKNRNCGDKSQKNN